MEKESESLSPEENKEALRDQLAMSMPEIAIPTFPPDPRARASAMRETAVKLGLELDIDDQFSVIEFMENFHALIRYTYADAMLWAREQPKKKLHSIIKLIN